MICVVKIIYDRQATIYVWIRHACYAEAEIIKIVCAFHSVFYSPIYVNEIPIDNLYACTYNIVYTFSSTV